jgi:OOP family OmpA-OmpF porin
MKKLITIFLLTSSTLLIGQNLVPNPSFEDTVACPYTFSDINFSTGWFRPAFGTSDFFHECGTVVTDVPSNAYGNQSANSGKAYAGFHTYLLGHNDTFYREYISIQLLDTLEQGTKYIVGFYVSRADTSGYATKIGAYFSDTAISQPVSVGIGLNLIPHVETQVVVTTRIQWVSLSFEYVASGGEQFITIGNFRSNSLSDTINTYDGGSNPFFYNLAYYYIDDIFVQDESTTGVKEQQEQQQMLVYPNPTNNWITLSIKADSKASKVTIYNMHGQEVLTESIEPNGGEIQLSLAHLPSALYLVHVLSGSGGIIASKKIIKE